MKKFVSDDQIPPVRKDAAHKLMDILNEQQLELKSEGSPNIVTLVEEARESKDPVVERLISKLVEMYRFNEQLGTTTAEIQRATKQTIQQNKDMHAQVQKLQIQKDSLENLCREMERKWKASEEENKNLVIEEDEKRKAMEKQFHQLVAAMKTSMEKEFQSIIRSRSGNLEEKNSLRIKFKSFLEEYHTREKHFNAVCKTKDSEYALLQAKYDQLNQKLSNSAITVRKSLNTPDIPPSSIVTRHVKLASSISNGDMNNEQFQRCQAQLQSMVQQLEKLQRQQQNESLSLHKLLEDTKTKLVGAEETIAKLESKCAKLENLCRALQERVRMQK